MLHTNENSIFPNSLASLRAFINTYFFPDNNIISQKFEFTFEFEDGSKFGPFNHSLRIQDTELNKKLIDYRSFQITTTMLVEKYNHSLVIVILDISKLRRFGKMRFITDSTFDNYPVFVGYDPRLMIADRLVNFLPDSWQPVHYYCTPLPIIVD